MNATVREDLLQSGRIGKTGFLLRRSPCVQIVSDGCSKIMLIHNPAGTNSIMLQKAVN
jgi:hypothetical protein